jgi:prephenate dehydrogenase
MITWNRVAIVGVGLIGGSIGIDLLRRKLARHVVGIGRSDASLRAALRIGAVSSTTTDLAEGVRDVELVIVCTPVGRIVEDVRQAARFCPPGALITDAGSTKADIVAHLDGVLPAHVAFVGSHPLAGGERRGPTAAVADLFVDRLVVLTPTIDTTAGHVEVLHDFWSSLGARVISMTPEEHDRIVAVTSHLPHLVASALAASIDPSELPLVARGWLDTTRIAAGDAGLWRQIFDANRTNVLAALRRFEESLGTLRQSLEVEDLDRLEALLDAAKHQRDRASANPNTES